MISVGSEHKSTIIFKHIHGMRRITFCNKGMTASHRRVKNHVIQLLVMTMDKSRLLYDCILYEIVQNYIECKNRMKVKS